MIENQLSKMLDKYPHLREQREIGVVFEILLEDELNGSESAMELHTKYSRDMLMKTKKGKDYLKEIDAKAQTKGTSSSVMED